jgi:hypothetical protein
MEKLFFLFEVSITFLGRVMGLGALFGRKIFYVTHLHKGPSKYFFVMLEKKNLENSVFQLGFLFSTNSINVNLPKKLEFFFLFYF